MKIKLAALSVLMCTTPSITFADTIGGKLRLTSLPPLNDINIEQKAALSYKVEASFKDSLPISANIHDESFYIETSQFKHAKSARTACYKLGAQYAFNLLATDAVVAKGYRMINQSMKLQKTDLSNISPDNKMIFGSVKFSF